MKNISLTGVFCSLVYLAIGQASINEAAFKGSSKYKADLDTQFDKGSAITSIPLDPRRTNDLYIVGKVWGFVKYYHPALQAGDYNWDYELFRVLPKIIQCDTDKKRNEILHTWISQLGKVITEKITLPDSSLVKMYPDIQWIDDKVVLGDQLSALLNDIKNASREKTGYYLGIGNVGNADLKNEKRYSEIPFPDAGFRLLTLYRYWNIIQYLFPYKYLIEENWNTILKEFVPTFLNANNELDYKLATLALIARVHDTHATIRSNDKVLEKYHGNYAAPLEISFVENKAVVTDYLDREFNSQKGFQKGDIVISINGKSTDSIVKERLPYTPASNYPTQLRDMAIHLLRTSDTVMNITYKRANTINTVTITCYPVGKLKLYKKFQKKDTCFRYVTSDIVYIFPSTIQKDNWQKMMPELLKTKGMIIDMRSYMDDKIFYEFIKYLMHEPRKFARFTTNYTKIPGLFVFDKYAAVGTKNHEYYKGHIVILVNENTQSSGEYKSMALRATPHATVVGSTTAAADGNVSRFYLPGGIFTSISGIGVYYPDSRETQRVGIIPDYAVQPTIQGIIQNRDELVEKAVEVINQGK
ncbi:peptidase S41 [Niastella caeni]|uniref:Peptidase S41 n=1 Tax=Niastella caeni TaxID=2569763 RepID=A0A4S8HYQ5_9BACT|nr:S41 family peptidase [Niastella caeni]THU38372.1 peptidase S41 [Niastella caeni]